MMYIYLGIIIFFQVLVAEGSTLMPLEQIIKESLPIHQIKNDIVLVKINARLKLNQEIIVIRLYEDNVEVVAIGEIQGQQDQFWLIALNPKESKGLPTTKDRLLPIEKLNQPLKKSPIVLSKTSFAKSADTYRESGYIEFGRLNLIGDSALQTDILANQYKQFSYQFNQSHFLWYFDFLWRAGIFYSSQSSDVPVIGYDRFAKATQLNEERFELRFRLAPWIGSFKSHLKFINYSQSFDTTNEDEYILSTKSTGTGFGLYNYYEFSPSLWQAQQGIDFKWHRIYLDFNHISLSTQDGLVSRGKGAGTLQEVELGTQLLLGTNWFPWFNRVFVDFAYFNNAAKVAFTGPTQSAADGFYLIPESGQSQEINQGYRIRFGWRFDDYISQIFKSR